MSKIVGYAFIGWESNWCFVVLLAQGNLAEGKGDYALRTVVNKL